jgi:hypothetical protein
MGAASSVDAAALAVKAAFEDGHVLEGLSGTHKLQMCSKSLLAYRCVHAICALLQTRNRSTLYVKSICNSWRRAQLLNDHLR